MAPTKLVKLNLYVVEVVLFSNININLIKHYINAMACGDGLGLGVMVVSLCWWVVVVACSHGVWTLGTQDLFVYFDTGSFSSGRIYSRAKCSRDTMLSRNKNTEDITIMERREGRCVRESSVWWISHHSPTNLTRVTLMIPVDDNG